MNLEDLRTRCPLFAGIGPEEFEAVIGCLGMKRRTYRDGDYVFRSGERDFAVGVVLSGGVRELREDFWGRRTILAQRGEGELFAESQACAGEALPFDIVALGETEIMLGDYHKIFTPCANTCPFHGRLALNMARILARKSAALTTKLRHLSCRGTREKLLSFLSAQARQAGGDSVIIPFNRQELADYLGVDRSALSRELGAMRREGLLEFERNRFRLLRCDGGSAPSPH